MACSYRRGHAKHIALAPDENEPACNWSWLQTLLVTSWVDNSNKAGPTVFYDTQGSTRSPCVPPQA